MKGHAILGDDEFVDSLIDHLKKHKNIPDIPKSQRYLNRPSLEELFTEGILQNKGIRNEKIVEAVEEHGYRQREVAEHLGIFFTSVSRILRREQSNDKRVDPVTCLQIVLIIALSGTPRRLIISLDDNIRLR